MATACDSPNTLARESSLQSPYRAIERLTLKYASPGRIPVVQWPSRKQPSAHCPKRFALTDVYEDDSTYNSQCPSPKSYS
jgi:hypothetical protein